LFVYGLPFPRGRPECKGYFYRCKGFLSRW
jgi:hypothetical protein